MAHAYQRLALITPSYDPLFSVVTHGVNILYCIDADLKRNSAVRYTDCAVSSHRTGGYKATSRNISSAESYHMANTS